MMYRYAPMPVMRCLRESEELVPETGKGNENENKN
jgi:hypothetical protein